MLNSFDDCILVRFYSAIWTELPGITLPVSSIKVSGSLRKLKYKNDTKILNLIQNGPRKPNNI